MQRKKLSRQDRRALYKWPNDVLRFERRARCVVYVERENIYRVTQAPLNSKRRRPLDSRMNLVGIAAAVAYWEMIDKRKHCLGCANTVKAAWEAGDRYLLDTDEARRKAELVADLSSTKPDDIDICAALIDLQNAIAEVRLNNTPVEKFEILPACKAAIEVCYSIPGFKDWETPAKRRKFLYALKKRNRTQVVFTLMNLYFNYGSTPLLTTKQRQELLLLDRGEGTEGAVEFFDNCLRQITSYWSAG